MKAVKITYWISTSIIALMMIFASYSYFTNPEVEKGFLMLGFPDYFRIELGIAKLIGAVALLIPLPRFIKEWTYAGFGIVFISALIAHIAGGLPSAQNVMPVVMFAVLIVSYVTYNKLKAAEILTSY